MVSQILTAMKHSRILRSAFLFFFLFILLNYFYFSLSHGANLGSETDRLALLAFKSKVIDDPFGALSTWNDSVSFCRWRGVACSPRHRRVTALNLGDTSLTGTLSPFIGNLTFLRLINLQHNSFSGQIPHEIGRLFRLRSIILNRNMLQGEIPVNLSNCSELRMLDLVVNKLEGNIPSELGNLLKLKGLGLANNYLTGSISSSLANLSSLTKLSLSENRLSGNIPVELGLLKQLNMFQVSVNSLTGSVPTQLFNVTSSLDFFAVAENKLVGEIPPDIGFTLPNIRLLLLGKNSFTGQIPYSISNASKLERLDFSSNHFTGSIPENLGGLKNLIRLNFAVNRLGKGKGGDRSFLNSLVNCTHLEVISLSRNILSGVLPNSVANFSSNLTYLYMSANKISGSIPTGIGNMKNLIIIALEKNLIKGSIPSSVGNLAKLQTISLFGNRLSGEIPSSLGNLTFLNELSLQENFLEGNIPSALGNCHHLQNLDLSQNNLSGTIPSKVIGLGSLSGLLDLSTNHLTGPVPLEVGNLKGLRQLYLTNNKLSGEIPSSLENCFGLEYLKLSDNSFQGHIPRALSSLKGLQDLDLSRNNFSGEIPKFLAAFPFLQNLNLSFNNLEGEVPNEGVFKNASPVSVQGNKKLCGGISELHLHSCQSRGSKKFWQQRTSKIVFLTVPLPCCFLSTCCILFVLYHRKRKRRRKPVVDFSMEDKYMKISYAELLKATSGFSSDSLIGTGGYGSVYKGVLGIEETAVAVKVLDLQQRGASKSFTAECGALGSIRHRNIVKIITSCSSIDTNGNEFKALVYELMPNGSLDEWLHQEKKAEKSGQPTLNLMQRLSIAIDVANALDYMHHHCHTCTVHCDLKPSNVLLDHEMVAHVGDFGLARLLIDGSRDQTSTSRVKGSIGYIAPEYGALGEVSTNGDVHSFGILLLETFTGKRPTDDMFTQGLSLHIYAKTALPDQVSEILDPKILAEALEIQAVDSVEEFQPNLRDKVQEMLVSVLRVGVLCSAELPGDRMQIKNAVMELQEAQKMLQAIMS